MLKADAQDLKTVFEKQRKYKIPLFQRRYVWDQENQWEPLWQDIETIAERILEGEQPPAHFLGAVVLKQDETPSREIETRLVIDGQQRLTTLQLVLAATRDAYAALGSEYARYQNTVQFLIENQAGVEDEVDKFKVWPTQADRDEFQQVLSAKSLLEVQKALADGDQRLAEAYTFFHDKVDGWLRREGEQNVKERVEALQQTLIRGLGVVIIDLTLEDDAQVIFESLNARGTPLLESELVKNYLLYYAANEGEDTERLHNDYWLPFETEPFWSKEVKQGRLYRPRIEIYLQHFLTMSMAREVSAIKLFEEFKRYVASNGSVKPSEHMAAIHHYAGIYRSFDGEQADVERADFFYRIGVMEVSTIIPLLLQVFDRLSSDEDIPTLIRTIKHLESFLVRRMVCGLTTKQYNKLFLETMQVAQDPAVEPDSAVRDFLLGRTADSELWPKDEMFRNAWLSEPLYRRITRARLRVLLEALEVALRTPKTEPLDVPRRMTVEHLMPRAWREHWPLPEPDLEAEEARDIVIHTIGNLTLLTSSLNPALRNSPWTEKKPEILKHSLLQLSKDLEKHRDWSEDKIAERGERLFELAVRIWPYPKNPN